MVYGLCHAAASVSRLLTIVALTPAIIMASAAILLGLLGIFVLWLCIVAILVAGIVIADVVRRFLRRLAPTPIGSLEQPAIDVPGR